MLLKAINYIVIILLACFVTCSNKQMNNTSAEQKNKVADTPSCDYHRDLTKYFPAEFLNSIRLNTTSQNLPASDDSCAHARYLVMCDPAKNWIKEADIPVLLSYLDSNEVAAMPVYSTLASISISNHGKSTLANEAYHLISGYRTGTYPPYHSIPIDGKEADQFKLHDSSKTAMLTWYRNNFTKDKQ